MPNITVYSKPGCVQCDFTKKELNRNGLEFNEIDVTQDDKAVEALSAKGFQALPVVEVELTPDHVVRWSGFKPDHIREISDVA